MDGARVGGVEARVLSGVEVEPLRPILRSVVGEELDHVDVACLVEGAQPRTRRDHAGSDRLNVVSRLVEQVRGRRHVEPAKAPIPAIGGLCMK